MDGGLEDPGGPGTGMDGWLLAAAGLSLFGAVGHSVIGERTFLPPYLRSGIVVEKDEALTAATLRGAWHVWSLAYAAAAGFAAWAAFTDLDAGARAALWAFFALFLAAFVLLVAVTKGRLPAVVLQLAIAGCLFLGLTV